MKIPPLRVEPPPHGLRTAGLSLVEELVHACRSAIERHKSPASARLPPVRQMAIRWGVSCDTVVRAYERLAATGLVEARHGSGYFTKQAQTESFATRFGDAERHEDNVSRLDFLSRQLSIVKPAFATKSRSGVGSLPLAWLQHDRIATKLRELGRREVNWTDYPDPQGYLPLRQFVASHLLGRGIEVPADQILLTTGASEALQLIISVLARRSAGPVLYENPCSPMLVDMLLSMGHACETVPRLSDGPDLDELEALCQGSDVESPGQTFVVNSVHHNPTGSSLSVAKARRLARLAKRYKLLIVEDDSYGDLAGSEAPRLSEILGLQSCLYVGSFSKTLSPALRCGYVAGSQEHIKWLTIYRMVRSMGGSLLSERVIFSLLRDGGYDRHCQRLRLLLEKHREPAALMLRDAGLHVPTETEGMYLWARLPESMDALSLARQMAQRGHVLAPGHLFSPLSDHHRHLRFNVAETVNQASLARELAQQLLRAKHAQGETLAQNDSSPPH